MNKHCGNCCNNCRGELCASKVPIFENLNNEDSYILSIKSYMDNDAISFSARFGGVAKDIYVPIRAVLGLYARENGQGLFFDPSEYGDIQETIETPIEDKKQEAEPYKKKPSLRILD